MGEVAEMMLDGTLCEACGAFIGQPTGYPRCCRHCQREQQVEQQAALPRVACPRCGKRIKATGLKDHLRDAHDEHEGKPPRDAHPAPRGDDVGGEGKSNRHRPHSRAPRSPK